MHHGQEIALFFYQYGKQGFVGLFVTAILTGLLIYKSMELIRTKEIISYAMFLDVLIQRKKITPFFRHLINSFLVISFFIMIAGFSSSLQQEFGFPIYLGSMLASMLCFLVFSHQIDAIIRINAMIVPALILFILYLGFGNMQTFAIVSNENRSNTALLQSVIYSSYNSIILIPMLITLKNYSKTKKQNRWIAVFCSSIILLLSCIIFLLLGNTVAKGAEIPMLAISQGLGNILRILCLIMILVAIFTTAVSSGYGFLTNITKSKREYFLATTAICMVSIFVSHIGFSRLIEILYPIFGYLGLIQILFILKS